MRTMRFNLRFLAAYPNIVFLGVCLAILRLLVRIIIF